MASPRPRPGGLLERSSSPACSGRAIKRILVHFTSKFPHLVRLIHTLLGNRSVLEKVYEKVGIPNLQSSFEWNEVIGVHNGPNMSPILLVD